MNFDGNEDHHISLQEAAMLTMKYRESANDEEAKFLGGYFGKQTISRILNQDDCVGIRIYNAKSENGQRNFVLVGVDAEGEDLAGGELAEFVLGCPPFCPNASELAGTA